MGRPDLFGKLDFKIAVDYKLRYATKLLKKSWTPASTGARGCLAMTIFCQILAILCRMT